MKALLVLPLLFVTGCGFYRGHPIRQKVTMIVAGGVAGTSLAIAQRRGTCASMYDGKPYSGTPPCPIEVKGSKR